MKSILSFTLITLCGLVIGQSLKPGKWKGEIVYNIQTIPFIFEVVPTGGDVPEIIFINGKERRLVSNASIEGDSIFIPLDPFDVEIRGKFTATTIEGSYVKHYRNARMPFSASFGGQRFMKKSAKNDVNVRDRWKMTFSPDSPSMSDGVGLFNQIGSMVTGTVITETSDYRYFEGIVDGDSLKLSSFDGAHAFMILGKKNADGWEGKIVFDNNYSEQWVASYDPKAELTDPFELVTVEKAEHKPYFDLLGAGSGKDAIDVSKYEGKVVVLQVFGTWCPNSHDQTRYLVNWFNKNGQRNVSILASSYEANYSRDYGLERLATYREKNNIGYDLVLGGRLSKTAAATPFPFIERIKAFPTLVILDKQGFARYVCSYFNGPATGSYYDAFDRRFNEIIDELEAE